MATWQPFPTLCSKDCGFFGSPDTGGMCSKCFGEERGGATPSASASGTSTSSRRLESAGGTGPSASLVSITGPLPQKLRAGGRRRCIRDDQRIPSQTTDVFWTFTIMDDPDLGPPIIGKWLVFKPFDQIDDTWAEIRSALLNDELGGCVQAKSSTIRYNPSGGGPGPSATAAICVYAKQNDMDDIGFKLIQLVKQDIRFKPDENTAAGVYSHSASGPTTVKTIYWNDGKPSFVKEGKSRQRYGANKAKKDIWNINVVNSPEPYCSEEIHGRWVISFGTPELTIQWHILKALIEAREENIGVIKMVCPPKRSRAEKPVFHVYTSKDRKASSGRRLIRLVQRDIMYQQERQPGTASAQETLYWNNGDPDYVSTLRNSTTAKQDDGDDF